jgi:hypothetical protein
MSPTAITTMEQALEYARGYASVYGGDEESIKRMAQLVFEDAMESQAKTKNCGTGDEAKKACRCTGRISQKAMWLEHTKAADYGPLVDEDLLRGWLRTADKTLKEQVREVIKLINREQAPTDATIKRVLDLLKSSKWNATLMEGMRPYIASAMENGAAAGLRSIADIAKTPAVAQIGWSSAELGKYVEQASTRLASRAADAVNATTQVRIGDLLGEGLKNGESISQLAKRVEEWAAGEASDDDDADTMTRRRATTIARTEAARAHSNAQLEAWKSTGIVVGKRWLLAPDACEFCKAAFDQYGQDGAGLDEPFYKKGETLTGSDGESELEFDFEDIEGPPLHPNCRCATIAVLNDRYEDIAEEAERRMRGGKPKEIEA